MYECHVTVKADPTKYEQWKKLATAKCWKTSKIDGDPLLGDKVFFYFTTHHFDFSIVKSLMGELVAELGDDVVRQKIEHIVYDTKTGIGI